MIVGFVIFLPYLPQAQPYARLTLRVKSACVNLIQRFHDLETVGCSDIRHCCLNSSRPCPQTSNFLCRDNSLLVESSFHPLPPTLSIQCRSPASWARKPGYLENHRRAVETGGWRSQKRVEDTRRGIIFQSPPPKWAVADNLAGRENPSPATIPRLPLPTSPKRQEQ